MTTQRRLTVAQAFALAVTHHRGGDLATAAALYRQIIGTVPDHAPAHHHLGTAALQRGDTANAVASLRRALACDPGLAAAWTNLATAEHRRGHLEAAGMAARQAVRLQPDLAEAWVTLANQEDRCGRPDRAAAARRTAVALQPALAVALMRLPGDNLSWQQRAVWADPASIDARITLAIALQDAQRSAEAAVVAAVAVALAPENHAAWNTLGSAERFAGRPEAALARFRRAVRLAADVPGYHHNCGAALEDLDRPDAAAAAYHRALCLAPDMAAGWRSLASQRRATGLAAAITAARRGATLAPDSLDAGLTLAACLLSAEHYGEGWAAYEVRHRHAELRKVALTTPLWRGEPLTGRRLLVQCEQGLGDSLQFCRLVPHLVQRAGAVILRGPASLTALFDSLGVTIADEAAPPPPHDGWVPLLSLPHRFGLEQVPAAVPYLRPPAERLALWRARLPPVARRRIGLVWAGSPGYHRDIRRSLPLESLRPLLRADAAFVSLQVGAAAAEMAGAGLAGRIDTTLAPDLRDFADTAAVITQLDLVISVDTAVAHLAGALGRPVWILLPFGADWRWRHPGAEDSPWYPTARLFRQHRPGDWDEVVARLAAAAMAAGAFSNLVGNRSHTGERTV